MSINSQRTSNLRMYRGTVEAPTHSPYVYSFVQRQVLDTSPLSHICLVLSRYSFRKILPSSVSWVAPPPLGRGCYWIGSSHVSSTRIS